MIRIATAVRRVGAAALLGLAVVSCRDATGPKPHRAYLALAPVLPAEASNLAAFGLSIDALRIVIARSPTDTVADTTVAFAVDLDSISLALSLALDAPTESFDVTLELRGGGFVLFSATAAVIVQVGGPSTNDPVEIAEFVYTGPGAGVTTLLVGPLDSVIRLGDSLRFRVNALADGIPVTQFYVSWSTDNETLAPINAHGVLRAPLQRGIATVTARTPTGVTGTALVTFIPLPVSVVPVGPIPQNVLPGVPIGPLRVQVLAGDGLGVQGIPVTFQPVSGGGSITNAVVVTDGNGFAQTPAISGLVGTSVFRATVPGVATPALFNISVLPAGGTQLAFTLPPAGGLVGVPFSVAVEVRDGQGNVVLTATNPVTVALGANPGGATLSGTTTINAVAGAALFSGLSLDQAGTGYTLVASAAGLTPATSPPFAMILGLSGRRWSNPAGGNWSNPANWSGGVVPGVADTVFIALDGDYTVALDVDATVAELFVGGATGTQILTATNRIIGIDSGAVFGLQSRLNLVGSTLNLSPIGTVLSSGTIAVAPGTSRINGALLLNAGSLLRLTGDNGPASLLVDGELFNQGTIELTGTSWGGNLTVTNGELTNAAGATLHAVAGVGNSFTGVLDNQGLVRLSGGPLTVGNAGQMLSGTTGTFNVAAGRTLTVNGGTLAIGSATGLIGTGTIALGGTATLSLVSDVTFAASGPQWTFPGVVTVSGPGVLTNQATLALTSDVVNAALSNTGVLEVPGSSTSQITTLTQTGTLRLNGNNGPAALTVANGFTNQGTIELTGTSWGGQLTVTGGTLTNAPGATLQAMAGTANSYTGALFNQGTVRADGPFTIANAGHTLTAVAGTVDVTATRTLTVSGGTVQVGAGTVQSGTGTIDLAGAATLALASDLTIAATGLKWTFSGTVTVNGPGTLTNQGTLLLTSDVVNAALSNAGVLEVPGSSTSQLMGPFTQTGTMRLNGNNGPATLTVASSFTNQGTVELTGTSWGGNLTVTSGALTNALGATLHAVAGVSNNYTGALVNQGLLRLSGGPLTVANAGQTLTGTTGTFDVAAGRTLMVNGGTLAIGSGTALTGSGVIALGGTTTLSLVSDVTLTTTGPQWTFPGTVTVAGPGVLTNQATLLLTSDVVNTALSNAGVLEVPGSSTSQLTTLTQTGTLRLNGNNGPAALTVNGFTNQGTIELTGTSWGGNLTVTTGTLTNAAGATVHALAGASNSYTGILVNQGLVRLTGGPLTVTTTGQTLTGTNGTFDVAAGRTLTVNGGTLAIGSGTGLIGTGTIALGGPMALTLVSDVTFIATGPQWVWNGAVIVGGPGRLTNQTTLVLNGDVVNAPLTNQGLLEVTGSGTGQLSGPLTQAGTVRLNGNSGPATLSVANGFTNQGTIELTGTSWGGQLNVSSGIVVNAAGATLAVLAGSLGVSTLAAPVENHGTLVIEYTLSLQRPITNFALVKWSGGDVQAGGGATLDVQPTAVFDVSSSGTWLGSGAPTPAIEIRDRAAMNVTTAGATTIQLPMVLNVAGVLTLQSGATLKVTGDFNLLGTGELAGTGTLDVATSPKVTNVGSLRPGGGVPGILTIAAPPGAWPQGTGSRLEIDIAGTVPGSEYDQVVVVGAATLGGILNVNRTVPAAPRLTEYYPLTATVDIGGVLLPGNLNLLVPPMTLLPPDLVSNPKRVILQQL